MNSYEILVNNSLIAIQGPESNNILSFLKIEDKFLFMSARIIIFLNKERKVLKVKLYSSKGDLIKESTQNFLQEIRRVRDQ